MATRRSPTRGQGGGGALEPPPGLRTSALSAGDHSLVVFSYPIPTEESGDEATGDTRKGRPPPPATDLDVLTPIEREVVRALLGGQTNAEIAALRGRSVHTINRQVEAAYRKLGVGSRGELCARLGATRKRAR